MSPRSRIMHHLLTAMLAMPSVVVAQGRDAWLLPVPTAIGAETGRAQPGVTASSPLGFGPSAGNYFVGLGYQGSTRGGGDPDGSVSVGAGFGNAKKLGLELVVNSASTFRSGFGQRMYGSAKAHRVLGNGMGLGVGIEGLSLTGDAAADPSVYAAISNVTEVAGKSVTLNGGIGTSRFAPEAAAGEEQSGVGIFASAAIRLMPTMSMIADYAGQDLALGLSFAPFRSLPVTISPALVDVLGAAGDGMRMTLGVGMSFTPGARRETAGIPAAVVAEAGMAVPVEVPRPPADADDDGVADTADACANTSIATPVDARGCPLPPPDDDKDGVPNATDACPATPAGAMVNETGCVPPPPDDDKDGVPNAADACPATPVGATVTANGCVPPPPDADKDGVIDANDRCPNTVAGNAVNPLGCDAVFAAAKTLVLDGVAFPSGSSVLGPQSRARIDAVVAKLVDEPSLRIEVGGHTDNTGQAAGNVRISQARANAVRTYMISKGIAADRITAKGYGSQKPLVPNTTPANRAKNRRVELTPLP